MELDPSRSDSAGNTALLAISEHIWNSKYRWREDGVARDHDIADSWARVARAVAAVEGDADFWTGQFKALLQDFAFLPGGRILAGAGTGHKVTLFNCFVMGGIEDSLDGIFDALKAGALTMQQGGGVGYDFSTLRPRGSMARGSGALASGPVSFMAIWNAMCGTLLSTGARRGAMMATLRCDHPDIEEFIAAKSGAGSLEHFNLSVLITDEFMRAVADDGAWPLVFPCGAAGAAAGATLQRAWSGSSTPVPCRIHKTLAARELWRQLQHAAYQSAEPGVLFIDRINHANNLYYCEQISATNPCGEVPLPPYGACDLGSLNLCALVRDAFTPRAAFDMERLRLLARQAVRFMDNVVDVSAYPLPQQQATQVARRRLGIGITGLADALIMLNLRYDSAAGRDAAAAVVRALCHECYHASCELAREKGAFPLFARDHYLAAPFVRSLPAAIRDAIAADGIRNSHLLAIAPTGTVSLLADNVSSGLEPVFALAYERRLRRADGGYNSHQVECYAARRWRQLHGAAPLPAQFVCAQEIAADQHLAMQAALQPYIDNAISKTINLPATCSYKQFGELFTAAYHAGLKGCTVFRPNPARGAVLEAAADGAAHCCNIDREND